jgi:hypothetical protein
MISYSMKTRMFEVAIHYKDAKRTTGPRRYLYICLNLIIVLLSLIILVTAETHLSKQVTVFASCSLFCT